ncbi:MAG: hypothetical protein CFE44_10695 [Burkholderiales bacterium PBB4]|nr:MAG: hypothetical protein CFE44_10695 [Burkholderiales bacterium PBB4]
MHQFGLVTVAYGAAEGCVSFELEYFLMKPHWSWSAWLALSSSLLILPAAYAQMGPGGAGVGGAARHGDRERSKGCDTLKSDTAQKLTDASAPVNREQLRYQLDALQVDLRLTPAQIVVWIPFAERMHALQSDWVRDQGRTALAAGVAQDFALIVRTSVDRAANRMSALEDLENAAKQAFATLQPDQRMQADLRLAPLLRQLIKG